MCGRASWACFNRFLDFPRADLGGRCKGWSPPEMTCGFLTQLVFCINISLRHQSVTPFFSGVPPPKKTWIRSCSLLTEPRINLREKRPRLAGNFSACTPWQTYYVVKYCLIVKQHSFCPILLCCLFIDISVTTRLVQTLDILWGSRSMKISILDLSTGMFWSRSQQRPWDSKTRNTTRTRFSWY